MAVTRQPRTLPGFTAEQSAALFSAFGARDDQLAALARRDATSRIYTTLGSLRVSCVPNQANGGRVSQGVVNGAALATFTAAGLIVLTSNGATGWTTAAEHPAESAATPGITPTSSAEILPSNPGGSIWTWALRPFSVALGRLAKQVGLTVLGNASDALAAVSAITATGARQALLVNSSGTAIDWRALELADLPTLPVPGWDDTLATDATSNGHNPIVSVGDFLQLGAVGPTTSSPQIRSGDTAFRIAGGGSLVELSSANQVRLTGAATGTNAALSWLLGGVARLTVLGNGEWSNPAGGAGKVWTWQSGAFPTWATVDLSSVTYTAGDGIDLTGLVFSADVSDFAGTGLEDDGSNNLRIAAAAAGNGLTGGAGSALAVGGSTSIIVGANDVQRAALTNEVTASQNSNACTVTRSTNFQSSPWTGSHQFNACVVGANAFSTTLSGLGPSTDNLAIGAVNCVRIASFALDSLTGMVPSFDGQWVWLENTNAAIALPIVHDSTSTAANRFYLPGNLAQVQLPARSGLWCRYDGTLARWIVSDTQQFAGISVSDVPAVSSVSGVRTLAFDVGTGASLSTSSSGTAPLVTDTIAYGVDQATNWSWTGTHSFGNSTLWSETGTKPTTSAGKGAYWFRNDTPCLPVAEDDTGIVLPLQNGLGTETAKGTATNSTTVIDLTKSYTIRADTLVAGSRWTGEAVYKFTRGSTATALALNASADLGSNSLAVAATAGAAGALTTNGATGTVRVVASFTIDTTGAAGSARAEIMTFTNCDQTTQTGVIRSATATWVVNTTIANAWRLRGQMGTAVANAKIDAQGGNVQWAQ